MVTIPNRRYFLFHGSLTDLGSSNEIYEGGAHMLTSRLRSPGRLTTVGASPATSTPLGNRSRASSDRHTPQRPRARRRPSSTNRASTHLPLTTTSAYGSTGSTTTPKPTCTCVPVTMHTLQRKQSARSGRPGEFHYESGTAGPRRHVPAGTYVRGRERRRRPRPIMAPYRQ